LRGERRNCPASRCGTLQQGARRTESGAHVRETIRQRLARVDCWLRKSVATNCKFKIIREATMENSRPADGNDACVVFLVQPVVEADGEERAGDFEKCASLADARGFASFLRNLGLGAILWGIVMADGIVDPTTLTEIGRFES
jgi:hypothetical protein